MEKALPVLQACFAIFLFLVFTWLFAIPNIAKYLDDESLIIESYETPPASTEIAAPSIMLCPANPVTGLGWTNENVSLKSSVGIFKTACDQATDDLEACVVDNTYKFEESILDVILPGQDKSVGLEAFKSDMTFAPAGVCHTFENISTILTFGESFRQGGSLTINLNVSIMFILLVSDMKFTYFSLNKEAIPGIRETLLPENLERSFQIKITKHIKRNTAKKPCNENPDYSFTFCLKEKVNFLAECSLPVTTNSNLTKCKTLEQYAGYENIYQRIGEINPEELGEKFGCRFPCQYKEYQLVEELGHGNTTRSLQFALATTTVLVRREVEIYGWASLVGDLGGSLGLFLGFSIFMLWDWVIFAVNLVKHKY